MDSNKKNLLITGGAGFIGSNFIKLILKGKNYKVINVDSLTYAGNLKNLIDIENDNNYKFIKADISNFDEIESIFSSESIDGIINFAAESHVDRSIMNSIPFLKTNVQGTVVLLDLARKFEINRFLQISTDEVYGSLGADGKFTERTNLKPNSPYSASKTAADNFVRAYYETFGLPTLITRCSNNYGPFQFPEKLIPLMIINALNNKELPVYGDGKNIRDWIYVEDHCEAILKVFESGKPGQVYNVGAENEMMNIEIVELILDYLEKPRTLIKYVKDRPGHDRRYAIDNTKIYNELNWKPKYIFNDAIKTTIEWYLNNLDWCNEILSGEYLNYYKKNYGRR